jgi:hypothetical protein
MADAHEALGQDVQQKTADELLGREPEGSLRVPPPIVSHPERGPLP